VTLLANTQVQQISAQQVLGQIITWITKRKRRFGRKLDGKTSHSQRAFEPESVRL